MLQLQNAAERLSEVETRVQRLRDERSRARKVAEAAKRTAQANDDDSSLAVAMSAKEAAEAVDAELEKLTAEQTQLLRELGDNESGRSWTLNLDGWAEASRKLDVQRGELRADLPAASLLAETASSPPVPAPVSPRGDLPSTSNRWLYPMFPMVPFPASIGGEPEFVASDYTVTLSQDALTGIERDVDATTDKAVLPMDVALAAVNTRQYAVVAENLPSRIFETQRPLQELLSREVGRRLNDQFDANLVGAIEAAAPPTGSTGTGLVAQVRNAIADARDLGSEPRVLALTPQDAAGLDLSVDGSGRYVFQVDRAGSGSPVWTLQIREAPSVSQPLLVDPERLGLVYTGSASVLIDPYGANLKANLVSVRVEYEAAAHIRNIIQGAFAIG